MTDSSSYSMPDDVVVDVRNVSKKFCRNLYRGMYYGLTDLLRQFFGFRLKSDALRQHEFWAVEDVSFRLKRGEIMGIIGLNGAGKSTLLRVLNGIFPPDRGEVHIRGRIGGLISLGAGFHPHFTGRENIYLNGSILGMAREEIDENLSSIIEFADIGDFIDAPVSTYSSGMYVRLGFAIAIHSHTDILLIDEVMSVGDVSFQNKCVRKIAEMRAQAKAVIFISHNIDHVNSICSHVIVLRHGKVDYAGAADEAVRVYLAHARQLELAADSREMNRVLAGHTTLVESPDSKFIGAGIVDMAGQPVSEIQCGDDIKVYYDFEPLVPTILPILNVAIVKTTDTSSNYVTIETNILRGMNENPLPRLYAGKRHRISVTFQKPNLVPGVYRIRIGLINMDTLETYHQIYNDPNFDLKLVGEVRGNFAVHGKRYSPQQYVQFQTKWECDTLS